ncbi:hypothetical protein FBZ91_102316 [Nitrospirillum viridazoti]|nr:hypothetical protein FBZ91_102316 [Nitrospirillum amazonense]
MDMITTIMTTGTIMGVIITTTTAITIMTMIIIMARVGRWITAPGPRARPSRA